MQNNNYKGYSLFNDIDNAALRTWNRCVVVSNGNVDRGQEFVEGYTNNLSQQDKFAMMMMLNYIKIKGAEIVRMEINQGKHNPKELVAEKIDPKVFH